MIETKAWGRDTSCGWVGGFRRAHVRTHVLKRSSLKREERVDSANDWHDHYMTRAVTACGLLGCAQHSGLGFGV